MRCFGCGLEVDVSLELPGSEVRCPCGLMLRIPEASPSSSRPRIAPSAPPPAGSAAGRGSPFRRPGPRDEDATPPRRGAPCPRCRAPMFDVPGAPGGEALACGTCGVFVAPATLEALIAEGAPGLDAELASSAARRAESALDVRYLPCPRCDKPMDRRTFAGRSGIVVDVCPAHGTFFDALELERALAFLRRNPDAGAADAKVRANEIPRARLALGATSPDPWPRYGLRAVLARLGDGD